VTPKLNHFGVVSDDEPCRDGEHWEAENRQQHAASFGRVLAPFLVMALASTAAHAQGTMDFTQATTLMGTFKTFFKVSPLWLLCAG